MDRKLSTLGMILVVLLAMPIVNALFDPLEFHKVHPDLQSEHGYGLYKIDTSFWGIDIADIELMENSDYCFSNCYAKLRIKAYRDIDFNSNDFGVIFSSILTENMKFNDFEVYVDRIAIDYYKESVCSNWINKSVYSEKNKTYTYYEVCEKYNAVLKNITYIKEIPITFSDFKIPEDSEIYLTIRGEKSGFEAVDWKLNFLGYQLNEWIWWNGYNFSQNNTNPTIAYDIPMSLNGSAGINGTSVWINPSQLGSPQALFIQANRSYGNISYANWSDEGNFDTENESLGLNNSPTDVYVSALATGVYHLEHGFNSSTDMFNGTNFAASSVNRSTDCAFSRCYEWSGGKLASSDQGIVTGYDFNSTQNFSIECWYKWDDVTTAQAGEAAYCGLFGDYGAAHTGMSFRTEANCENIYGWISNGVADPDNTSTTDLNSGGRHLITFTYNNSNSRGILWVNTTIELVIDSDYADSNNNLIIGAARYAAAPNIYVWDGEIDECRVYYKTLGVAEINATLQNFLNNNNMLGPVEQNGTGAITLDVYIQNVTEQDYREDGLTPVLIVNATNSFNWTLQLYHTNGTNYTINSSNELAGDWYNNTQTINTSNYQDGIYYLNLSVIDSASNTAYNVSTNFTIDNLQIKLWNVSNEVYTQTNELLDPDVEIYSDISASADLTLYNGASSWSIASWSLTGGNYTNSSISYNVSNFSESDNYYVILNVTKGGWTESNTSDNFTIDTQGPNISFDWNLLEGEWIAAVNPHHVDLLIDDLTDTGIINCTIDSNTNDLSKSGCEIQNTSTRQEATSFFRVAWNSSEFNGSYIYSINAYLRVNETPSTATAMAGVILQNGTEYNSSLYTTTSTTYSLKEIITNSSGKVEWVNLYIRNNNGNFTQIKNWTINHTGFIDGNNYLFPVPILNNQDNDFNITCRDKRGNTNSYTADDINIQYTKLTILDEDNRTSFPICNYNDRRMIVQPTGTGNISYETTNCSEMNDSYFILMNDSIESIRLSIGTTNSYYRGLTDYQDIIGNITLYMYNASKQSSSQVLFIVDTVGYDRPILVRRPRDDGEQDITSEYPVGSDREVNAYLIDSRLYNIYAYSNAGNLILIDSIMVAGARTIHLTIPNIADMFLNVRDEYAYVFSENYTADNWTLYAQGYSETGSYNIILFNSTNNLVASGVFTDRGLLTYDVGNISGLNETYTYFCAVFEFPGGNVSRCHDVGNEGLDLGDIWGWLGMGGSVLISIVLIVAMLGVAAGFASYSGELGLFVGAGIGFMGTWAFSGVSGFIPLIAAVMAILGGIVFILRLR